MQSDDASLYVPEKVNIAIEKHVEESKKKKVAPVATEESKGE